MDVEQLLQKLPNKQRKVLEIFMQGGKYSVADLCIRTHFSDPRTHIRYLREKGINIADEWITNNQGDGRYKVYFLAPKERGQTKTPLFDFIEKYAGVRYAYFDWGNGWMDYVLSLKSEDEQKTLHSAIVHYGHNEDLPTALSGASLDFFNNKVRPELDRQHKAYDKRKGRV